MMVEIELKERKKSRKEQVMKDIFPGGQSQGEITVKESWKKRKCEGNSFKQEDLKEKNLKSWVKKVVGQQFLKNEKGK